MPQTELFPSHNPFAEEVPNGAIANAGLCYELPANTANLEAYFDNFMINHSQGNISGDPTKQARYRECFTGLVNRYFNLDLLMYDRYPGQEHNPILDELGGMIASLDHNAGIYYSEADVPSLFSVIASHVLDDTVVQDKFQRAGAAGSVNGIDDAFKEGVEKTCSLDREKSLAVVQEGDGQWRVADEREYDGDQDFKPLEIIRQDNADKGGWNKYRFRSPTYKHREDSLHNQAVADGWYTTDWQSEPNYWSGQLRAVLVEGLAASERQLQGSSTSIVLVTEGGVLKGTATSGTDIDTVCVVVGDSLADFEQAYRVIHTVFPERLASLPFDIKEGQGVWPSFFDRSSGKTFYRDSRTGNFTQPELDQLFEGGYVFQIRKNEKGIGVTTSTGFETFKKPHNTEPDGSIYVSVGIESGDVHALMDEELHRYQENRADLKSRRRKAAVEDSNWVW